MNEPTAAPPPALPRPFYKQIDFWAGFVGWWMFNGLYWGALLFLSTLDMGDGLTTSGLILTLLMLLPLPASLTAILVAAFLRRRLAGGLLAALALNLVITLVRGAFINAICGIPFFFSPN